MVRLLTCLRLPAITAILLPLTLSVAAKAGAAPGTDDSMKRDDPLDFLHPGETLVFTLSYGIFGTAGETRVKTYDRITDKGPRRYVEQTTTSRGAVEMFYPLRSNATSVLDLETGRTLLNETEGREGSRESGTTTVFDYETGLIIHTDHHRERRSGTSELPDGNIYDIMITMMQARTLNLEPGTSRTFTAIFEDDIYHMQATALRERSIRVPAGTFNAVEVELKQLGEPKGFFRKGGEMSFWLSTGDDPQVVQIDLRTRIGTIRSRLSSIEVAGS